MTDQELLELNLDTMTEDEAREYGMEIISEEIPRLKSSLRIGGLVCAILAVIWILTETVNKILSYAVMGLTSFFLMGFFNSLQSYLHLKKMLKQYGNRTYKNDYKDFIRQCQEHVRQKQSAQKKKES